MSSQPLDNRLSGKTEMEYLRALSVHFAALILLFMGAMGLLSASFGNISIEREMVFLSIGSEIGSRKLNALLGILCFIVGGGILWLAVREFRPPSYALLLIGSSILIAILMLTFKLMLRSVEAMESIMAKGVLFLVNGLILSLLLTAVFYLGQYFWRVFVAL
jgi:hypothetical protein